MDVLSVGSIVSWYNVDYKKKKIWDGFSTEEKLVLYLGITLGESLVITC